MHEYLSVLAKMHEDLSVLAKMHEDLSVLSKMHEDLSVLAKIHEDLSVLAKIHEDLSLLAKMHEDLSVLAKMHVLAKKNFSYKSTRVRECYSMTHTYIENTWCYVSYERYTAGTLHNIPCSSFLWLHTVESHSTTVCSS